VCGIGTMRSRGSKSEIGRDTSCILVRVFRQQLRDIGGLGL